MIKEHILGRVPLQHKIIIDDLLTKKKKKKKTVLVTSTIKLYRVVEYVVRPLLSC